MKNWVFGIIGMSGTIVPEFDGCYLLPRDLICACRIPNWEV